MAPRGIDVGPLEMQVLGILDGRKSMAVSEIQAVLKAQGSDLAYTTVMTVLVRLFKKSYLKRDKEGRQFLYSTVAGKENSSAGLFQKVRKSLFHHERLKPILALLENESDLTAEELKELKKIVDGKLRKSTDKT